MLQNFAKFMFRTLDKSESYYIMLCTIFDKTRNILPKKDTIHYLLLHKIFANMYTIYEFLSIGIVFTHARVQYILLCSNGPLVHTITSMLTLQCDVSTTKISTVIL